MGTQPQRDSTECCSGDEDGDGDGDEGECLTVSAGLPVLEQLDSSGTGTLIVGLHRREEAKVGTSSILHRTRAVHCRQSHRDSG